MLLGLQGYMLNTFMLWDDCFASLRGFKLFLQRALKLFKSDAFSYKIQFIRKIFCRELCLIKSILKAKIRWEKNTMAGRFLVLKLI